MNDESLNEVLFGDPGKKIQKMAQIFFWVEVIACVILAFCLGWEEINRWGDKEFCAGIFFGFLIGGPLASYCSALMMYGFGELVDTISKIHNSCVTSGDMAKNSAARPADVTAQKNVNQYVDTSVKSEDRKTTDQDGVKPIACDDPKFIKCPSCWLVQNRENTVCRMCGKRFIVETDIN